MNVVRERLREDGSEVGPGKVVARFAAAFAAALIISSVTTYALSRIPGWVPPKTPEKTARLALIPAFIVVYWRLGRRDRPPFLVAAALDRFRERRGQVVAGFLAGAASLVAFLGASYALGWWVPRPDPESAFDIVKRALFYPFAGLFLALWEEGLFRGLVTGDMQRAAGRRAALAFGCAAFAVSHFLAPKSGPGLSWTDPWIGPRAAASNLEGLLEVHARWPFFVGLFMVAWVLTQLRLRTGSAWLCVGVHAGWYYVMQMDGRFLKFAVPHEEPPLHWAGTRLWSGSPEYADGVAGWAALLLTYFVALRLVPRAPAGDRT